MGKDLKGKELGIGLSQLKNGLYTARYTDNNGKRQQIYSKHFQDCRKWLANAPSDNNMCHIKEHDMRTNLKNRTDIGMDTSVKSNDDFTCMTVEQWFIYWITKAKKYCIRAGTQKTYMNRYYRNINEHIGDILITNVKPIHCQNIINEMADIYASRTMRITKSVMHEMFEYAVENDIIDKNPVSSLVKCGGGKKSKPERVLTLN